MQQLQQQALDISQSNSRGKYSTDQVSSSIRAEPLLVFLHIPKTGGTTLERILDRQYGRNRGLRVNSLKQLLEVQSVLNQSTTKFIKGHLNLSIIQDQCQGHLCQYLTLLRHPVDRVISYYYFMFSKPHLYNHYPLHQYIYTQKISLREYVMSELSTEAHNLQVTMLATEDQNLTPLESAQRHLRETFSAFGLLEYFDTSLLLCSHRFNWRVPLYAKENQTLARPLLQDVPREIIRVLEQKNSLDLEFYAYAEQLFQERLAQQLPASFAAELAQFRQMNNLYRQIYPYYALASQTKNYLLQQLRRS